MEEWAWKSESASERSMSSSSGMGPSPTGREREGLEDWTERETERDAREPWLTELFSASFVAEGAPTASASFSSGNVMLTPESAVPGGFLEAAVLGFSSSELRSSSYLRAKQ